MTYWKQSTRACAHILSLSFSLSPLLLAPTICVRNCVQLIRGFLDSFSLSLSLTLSVPLSLSVRRLVLLWEKKIALAKETQEAIDPNVGSGETQAINKVRAHTRPHSLSPAFDVHTPELDSRLFVSAKLACVEAVLVFLCVV